MYVLEQAEYEAKLAAREAKIAATGKKPGGKPPQPLVPGVRPNDQINLTDEESRIMPVPGGGFEQCYNAQAAVAAGSMLVVVADVVQAPNDKQQLAPIVEKIAALPKELGEAETLLADTGYSSADNVAACNQAGIDPLGCRGPSTALSAVATAVRTGAAGAQTSDAGPNHGASRVDAGRPGFVCAA